MALNSTYEGLLIAGISIAALILLYLGKIYFNCGVNTKFKSLKD